MRNFLLGYLLAYFALAGLVPGLDVSQWAKLPALISHYEEDHETSDFGFLEFLTLHYLEGDSNEKNPKEHEKLPLFHLSFANVVFLPTVAQPRLKPAPEAAVCVQKARYFAPFLSSDFASRGYSSPREF